MLPRNPFSSLTNLSFQRNAQRLPHNLPQRTEYHGAYLRDSYLADYQLRHDQEHLCSRLLGTEALRYCPPVSTSRSIAKSQNEYYNGQNCGPLTLSSRHFASPKKESTFDMFGSQYFNNKGTISAQSNEDSQVGSPILLRKPTITKKDTICSNNSSRFKCINKELEQLCQQSQQSRRSMVPSGQEQDPQTLFLKSRKTLFYRYHQPEQD